MRMYLPRRAHDSEAAMRILFASMPFDGHFLPMTGLALQLQQLGHEVRFYAGPSFADRLERLRIPHVPFSRAVEINGQNLAEHFPDIVKLKGPKRIAFDARNIFFANIPAHYQDIVVLHRDFPFEVLVHDLSLIHISEPTRRTPISYAVFCLKKKKK